MSEELKPCPFCGGEAHMPYYGDRVECRDCKGSVMTIDAWNTRVDDRVSTPNPVVDHETGNMSDKLRPAVEVLQDIMEIWCRDAPNPETKAAAVIEADRQATRAALVSEIVAWLFDEEQEYPAGEYSGFAAMIREEIEAKWGKQ